MTTTKAKINSGLQKPQGERRNAQATKARILESAKRIFSEMNYAQAGLRDIANDASVNVALVARYFGSKEKLFEAALDGTIRQGILWNQPHAEFGERVVRIFVEDADRTPNPLPMLVHASSDPAAQAVALRLIREHILAPTAEWLGGEGAENRAAEILAICAGFYMYRTLLPLDQFKGSVAPDVRRWFEQNLQAIVDAGAPPGTDPNGAG